MSETTSSTEGASGTATSTELASASGTAPTASTSSSGGSASGRPAVHLMLSCTTFAQRLVGTPEEVWTRLLRLTHGNTKQTAHQWRTTLDALKQQPV